jgi:hypothetical protein
MTGCPKEPTPTKVGSEILECRVGFGC